MKYWGLVFGGCLWFWVYLGGFSRFQKDWVFFCSIQESDCVEEIPFGFIGFRVICGLDWGYGTLTSV